MSTVEAGTRTAAIKVRRDDLRSTEIERGDAPEDITLAAGQVLIKVDKFALTANNISYALAGELMNYWGFFPAEDGWGRVPVWGYGDVIRSEHPDVAVGERFWGYYPMSTHLVAEPDNVNERGFVDNAPHRRELVGVYNQYTNTAADPSYKADQEGARMVMSPLFSTSFILDDFFDDNNFFGAGTMIVGSASSKTGLGLAFLLHHNRDVKVVGLTSPGNVGFCESLGCYDQVVTYDALESIDNSQPVVFCDMGGDADVLKRLHTHFDDKLAYSCLVGGTHWENVGWGQTDLPGPKPAPFFAPDQFTKRAQEWGPVGLQERMGAAWDSFVGPAQGWIKSEEARGVETVRDIYLKMLDGKVPPSQGYILSLNE
ncbi:MAG: DUF2855 family protein [Alphaproteobacteria bacterium]